jgi:hypothetical protein
MVKQERKAARTVLFSLMKRLGFALETASALPPTAPSLSGDIVGETTRQRVRPSESRISESRMSESLISELRVSELSISESRMSESLISESRISESCTSESRLSESRLSESHASQGRIEAGDEGRAGVQEQRERERDR